MIGVGLLVGVCLIILEAVWKQRRERRKIDRWLRELDHAEHSRGITDQVCWRWPVQK